MARKTPKPFVRQGITFTSQYAYRQYLAASKGYASPFARNKAIAEARSEIANYPGGLTREQVGALAAMVADHRGRIGSFVSGQAIDKRGSNQLPREMVAMLRSMGGDQYPIWRLLYR